MEFDRAPLEVSKTCGWPRSAIILSWSKLQSYIFQPHPFSHFWKHSGPLLNAFQVLYPGKFAFARCSRLWGRQRYLWFVATMCSSRIIPEFIKNSGGSNLQKSSQEEQIFFLMEFDRAPLEVSKTCGWPRSAIILSWSKLQSYIFQPHPFSHFWKHSGPLLNAFQVLYPGKFAFARCSRLWGRQRYLWFVATMCSSRIIPEFIKNSGGLTFKNHLRRSKFFFDGIW